MAEIRNNQQFSTELAEAMKQTRAFFETRPERVKSLQEIELQLDIMQRRTADGQIPTKEEKGVIIVAGLAHDYFPQGPPPDGANRDREMLTYKSRLNQLNYYYANWPGSEPLDDIP
jgi:hypothetical protein